MIRRAAAFALLAITLVACPSIPEGRFECNTPDDCPDGWFCRVDGLCYAEEASCTHVCGDVNQDGQVDPQDFLALQGIVSHAGQRDCLEDIDVFRDGRLSPADVNVLQYMLGFRMKQQKPSPPCHGGGECMACNVVCGDVDVERGAHPPDQQDVAAFGDVAMTGVPVCTCQFWAADIQPDGNIAGEDGTFLQQKVNGQPVPQNCAP